MKEIPWDSKSESPEDMCEQCHDTGWGGDIGPGMRGNNELNQCDCNVMARSRRRSARAKAKEAKL